MEIEIPISDYVTYYVYKGDDADILVREVKDGVFKVLIREYYGDEDEFNEDVHFIRKSTLDELFRIKMQNCALRSGLCYLWILLTFFFSATASRSDLLSDSQSNSPC